MKPHRWRGDNFTMPDIFSSSLPDNIMIDMVQAAAEGAKRQEGHKENTTERFFEDTAHENTIGVAAELAFAQWSGLPADLEVRPHGDGCKDFRFIAGPRVLSIDVKAAKLPVYLLLKTADAERAADILVLAGFDAGKISFLGWDHKTMMLVSPVREFGYGITSHFRHHSELRPMWQLQRLIKSGKPLTL
jgi:hypothetical protein